MNHPAPPCLSRARRLTDTKTTAARTLLFLLALTPALAPTLAPTLAWAACEAPPPPVRDISADRFYVDTASSITDKTIMARNRAALATLDRAIVTIQTMADEGLTGNTASALCAGNWLGVWAKGGALLGRMSSRQAEAERKWRTAGIAMSYIKIRKMVEEQDRIAIDLWLDTLADNVIADQGWPRKRNNHVYWAGFAAGAVGTATGTRRHLDYARQAYDDAMTDIRADGTLPMELARRQKALDYHNFALAPLVMLAELAALRGEDQRGEDWYERGGGAIHRLAARVAAGLRDPKAFATMAHETAVEIPKGGILGWSAFYQRRFPDRIKATLGGPFRSAWMGGDLTLTARVWIKQ